MNKWHMDATCYMNVCVMLKKKITHGCVMSHECMRHVSYIFTSAVSLLDISRVYMDDSCRTNGWVTSHVHTQRPRWTWSIHMSHVTCIHWWAMSHRWMSHVTCTYAATTVNLEHTHESCHVYTLMSHVAPMDESRYMYIRSDNGEVGANT